MRLAVEREKGTDLFSAEVIKIEKEKTVMLETFANIAQILGFTIQVAQLASDPKKTNETEVVFAALLALSTTAKSWKLLHARYHPLGKQIHSVVGAISEHKNGRPVPKGIGDISANSIRELFFDGILNDAVANFKVNTRKEIREIQSSLDKTDPNFIKAVASLREFDRTLADEFVELAEYRNDALEIHEKFMRFLSDVSGFIGNPTWGETEIRYILDNRGLLNNELPQMVYTTDKILMSFLDIYIKVVNDHARVSNISSALQRM